MAAIQALEPPGRGPDAGRRAPRTWARSGAQITGDSQLRWIGPGEGRDPPRHRRHRQRGRGTCGPSAEGKPLWKLLVDMSPEQLVRCVDFRYMTDALTPARGAGDAATARGRARREREAEMRARRLPGVHDLGRLAGLRRRRRCAGSAARRRAGLDALQDEGRRATWTTTCAARRSSARRSAPSRKLMMDANQVWDVDEAIAGMRRLAAFDPWWIEEPTSPDDILGHARDRARRSRRSASPPASTATTA